MKLLLIVLIISLAGAGNGNVENSFCTESRKMDEQCDRHCYKIVKPLLEYASSVRSKEDQFTALKDKIVTLEATIKILEAQLKESRENKKLFITKEDLLTSNKILLEAWDTKNNHAKTNLSDCQTETLKLNTQIEQKNTQISNLRSQNISNADRISQLEEKVSENKVACQEETKTLTTQIQVKDSQVSELTSQNISNADKIRLLEEKVSESKAACQEETKKLSTQIQVKYSQISKLTSENISNAHKIKLLDEKVSENKVACQEETKTLTTQIQVKDSQISKLTFENISNADKIEQLEEKVSESKVASQEETKKLSTEIQVKDSQISNLTSQNISNADQVKRLEEIVAESCFGKAPGCYEIEVPGIKFRRSSFPVSSSKALVCRRFGTGNFNRSWDEYRTGFGDLMDFFIGLEKLHLLTTSQQYELRIDMKLKTGFVFMRYDNFQIAGNEEDFKIKSLGEYSGTGVDLLGESLNASFSTPDHDKYKLGCAAQENCGWWFKKCGATIHSIYQKDGIHWKGQKLLSIRMIMIRKYIKKTAN